MQIWPGSTYPLGATFDGNGTNFALFSEGAERVELCLFDDRGKETRVDLLDVDAFVWHAYLPQVRSRAALRLPGARRRTTRQTAQRFNPNKLLLDPYAKAVEGQVDWGQPVFGYNFGDPDSRNDEDSAHHMMKGVVVNPFFDWAGDRQPEDAVRGVVHLRGARQGADRSCIPTIPEEIRGTYSAIAHPAIIEHLQEARHHRDRAHAGAPVRQRLHPAGQGAVELLGLQHDRVLRTAEHVCVHGRARPAGAGVQGHGPRAPRRRASRSSSTSSTTTRPRATTWARRCRCAASTTPRTTASKTTTSGTTPTTPAPATA